MPALLGSVPSKLCLGLSLLLVWGLAVLTAVRLASVGVSSLRVAFLRWLVLVVSVPVGLGPLWLLVR